LESGNWDIYVVNADGTGQEDLTPTRDDEDSAVWSPDSTKIAFVAGRPVSADPRNEGTFDIYVMNADGGSRMRITSGLAVGHHLAWQPVFES
jgi:Tol biopolymer transport system component